MKTIIPVLLLLLSCCICPCGAEPDRTTVDITIPANALENIIRQALPLALKSSSSQMQGTIIIDRLDRLELHRNLVSVQGRITGSNLVMNSRIGGQDIRLKLGKISIPVTSDFLLRFDKKAKVLSIQPRLSPGKAKGSTANRPTSLAPLLAALDRKEYRVPLETLGPFAATISGQARNLTLRTTDIQFLDNALILKLQPKVGKTN